MLPEIHRLMQAHIESTNNPYFVVLGPTTSGKTGLSIDIATTLFPEIEIINADSRQLYTHLDIGTAKITTAEMKGVPHYLLSVLDPRESTSVGWYKKQSISIMQDMMARKKIPMFVGGSMLYISSLIDNLDLLYKTNNGLRIALEAEYKKFGLEYMYTKLQSINADVAATIDPHNVQYILRALEKEDYKQNKSNTDVILDTHTADIKLFSPFIIGTYRDRSHICTRIDDRLEIMLETGWIQEVQHLLQQGYTIHDPGMQSHGYREVLLYIQGTMSFDEMKQCIVKNTRAFAKRQMTWWRKDTRIHWFNMETEKQIELYTTSH